MLKITAISGWAVPETWFAEQVKSSFPNSDIKIVYPENPESAGEAKIILNQFQSQISVYHNPLLQDPFFGRLYNNRLHYALQ